MRNVLNRVGVFVLVLAVLWGLWEGWHAIGTELKLTWPFPVNDVTMPHLHKIVQSLFEPAQVNGPWLIDILWHASLFTAKECAVGFVLGSLLGFAIAVGLSQSRFLERSIFPLAILIYWLSNNLWTLAQQRVVYRWIDTEEEQKKEATLAARQSLAPKPGQKPRTAFLEKLREIINTEVRAAA